MRTRTIYEELGGKLVKREGTIHQACRELEDFDTRMKKQLYSMECQEGSRFAVPGFSKNDLQKVWGKL
jgi:hypothetical protein